MSINIKALETEVLTNIDSLVKIIIKMSQGEEKNLAKYLPLAEGLIMKTNPLLRQLLKRNELPLEQIYRQFISQKLPHPELQKCFGNLEPALEAIFALPVFRSCLKKQNPTSTTETTRTNLDQLITAIYPKERILKNYCLRSIKLDYFLPKRKLAIVITPQYFRRSSLNLTLLTLHEDLQIIEISPSDLNNPHQLYRKFPRLSSSF